MRKTLVIILLALLPPLAWGQDHTRPKVAVVLSGGGAKGVAHISALRAIEQAGIPIDIITGTSMGSLIGGLYAIGWTTDQLDSLVRTQDWTFLLTDRARPEALDIDSRRLQNTYPLWHAFTIGTQRNEGAGVIRGLNLDHLFDRLLAPYLDSISFDSLPIPFACVATDVVTNTEIDFHSGFLKQAMRASMSIPGVFTPVRWGNHLLVDGGLRNNYPADIARQMGADIVIGVTVQGDTLTADDITGPIDLFMQIIDINCKNKYAANIAMSDLVIPVDVSGYSAASFTPEAIDTLLRRGSEAAERYRSQLQAIGQRFSPEAADQTSPVAAPRLPRAQIHSPRSTLHSESPLLTSPIVGVTFRFDNEETGALQIGAQLPFVWHFPMQVSARLRLGKRMQFSAEHKIYPRGITSPSIKYSYQRNDIDLYKNGIRTYNIKNNQHTFHLTPLNSLFRRYKLRAGIRFDYYDYYDPILSSGSNAIVLDNQHFFSYFFESLLNTEDLFYFPTSGTLFLATFAYRTDNLA
ncbi:MAG: patatin-like phospholipase family protein, partial [Bacteroidales bacterium]|nr:patatin-like phospholipase family protein [Bacteroidales bacterium]